MQSPFALSPRTTLTRRAGVTIFIVLALLAVATTLFGIWTRSVLRDERQLRQRELQLQSHRLAQAGIARARARLADDPQYSGETWNVSADALGGRHAARVEIVAEAADDAIEVRATAIHPAAAVLHVRHTEVARVPHMPLPAGPTSTESSEPGERP